MKKNLIKKSFSVFIFIILCSGVKIVGAKPNEMVLKEEYEEILLNRNQLTNEETVEVKELYDFNGYKFILLEFLPKGYAIYDNKMSHVIELNMNAYSPYLGEYHNLIYGGPTHYYIKQTDKIVEEKIEYYHTVFKKSFLADSETQKLMSQNSKTISTAIEEQTFVNSYSQTNIPSSVTTYSTMEFMLLKNWQTISNLNTTGINNVDPGICGYVSGAMIVYYYYRHKGYTQFVPGGIYDRDFVFNFKGNRPNSTLGPDLSECLTYWANAHGAQGLLRGQVKYLPKFDYVWNLLKEDRPVVLLGNISGVGSHAITIFAAERVKQWSFLGITYYNNFKYWTHFGWDATIDNDYSNVLLDSSAITAGSAVYF